MAPATRTDMVFHPLDGPRHPGTPPRLRANPTLPASTRSLRLPFTAARGAIGRL